MLLSSAYAAPLEIDLRVGAWERAALLLAALLASCATLGIGATLGLRLALLALIALATVHGWQRARQRPGILMLYADGNVGCGVRADPQPAQLLQAAVFLGLAQLEFKDQHGRRQACVLFPDRLDGNGRHRLRLWLATHRPSSLAASSDARQAVGA